VKIPALSGYFAPVSHEPTWVQSANRSETGEETMESLTTGTIAGAGTFRCEQCGFVVTMAGAAELPPCPQCAGVEFSRGSLFVTGSIPKVTPSDIGTPERVAAVDAQARAAVEGPGPYLAWEEGREIRIVPLYDDTTISLGRSLSANVRFDDATVSRRHALVARDGDVVRVLDDRSLNGVFVNGERVTSRELQDGDEVLVGRYHLRFLLVPADVPAEPHAAV